MKHQDPRITIDEAPMGALQIAAVAITVGLNALDGFDVLSISLPGPILPLSCSVVPPAQVGNTTTFERSRFSVPKVR